MGRICRAVAGKHRHVVLQNDQHLAMAWVQTPSVCETEATRRWKIESEATEVIGRVANVVSIGYMGRPGRADSRIVVDK